MECKAGGEDGHGAEPVGLALNTFRKFPFQLTRITTTPV